MRYKEAYFMRFYKTSNSVCYRGAVIYKAVKNVTRGPYFSTFYSKILELGILNDSREMDQIKAMTVSIQRNFVKS